MQRFKIWLILLSVGLILLDKYSFISHYRDSAIVVLQKQTSLFFYRVKNYPQLVLQ